MDTGRRNCKIRLCATYLVTFVLLFLFFYYLMFTNKRNVSSLAQLKEEVSCISQIIVKRGDFGGAEIGCISGESSGNLEGSAIIGCDSREMRAYVDSIVKPKLNTLLDDVYNLKNQITSTGCNLQCNPDNKPIAITHSRVNYAADELGARINHVVAKPIGGSNVLKSVLGLDFNANPPINLLRSGLSPGSCFGFQGATATISIRLAKAIIVDEIAITHVSKEMTPMASVDNAPKEFTVYGLPHGKQEVLGQWTFNNEPRTRTQSYKVNNSKVIQNLVFMFTSNHGANTTCIYRLDVFGKLA